MNNVLHWNSVMLEVSRRDHSQGYANSQQMGPTRTSRAMAIVHLAIYNAVAAARSPESAFGPPLPTALPPPNNVTDAALLGMISGAAFATLTKLWPRNRALIEDAILVPRDAHFEHGERVGRAVYDARVGDGAVAPDAMADTDDHKPPYGGHHVDPYDPRQGLLGANWGKVTRFTGKNHQHCADYPGKGKANFLNDPNYKEDYDEVQKIGSLRSGSRTPEETTIGMYWGYDGANGIGVPPRLFNQIARNIAMQQGLTDLGETAWLFAKVNVAMADAAIDAWHYKFLHKLWRPVVAIRNQPGGNPLWAPLGAPQTNRPGVGPRTPPFPAYPSGHATFGAAVFQVLRMHFSNGKPIPLNEVLDAEKPEKRQTIGHERFRFISDEFDGAAVDADGSIRTCLDRPFESFAHAVLENAISRVFLGVHWRFDGLPRKAEQFIGGVPLGLAVGQEIHKAFASGNALMSTKPKAKRG